MARERRDGDPSSYEPQAAVPADQARRYEVVTAVLGGRMTISDGARELGIARVNMQTLVHRAQAALVESLTPKPTGPTPTPPKERALANELAKAQKRALKLETQLLAMDDMLGTAGEIIRHLRGLPPQSAKRSSPRPPRSSKPAASSDEDPEPATASLPSSTATAVATRVTTMVEHGIRAAKALGVRVHTLRRWRHRVGTGQPLLCRRGGRRKEVSTGQRGQLRSHVRALAGLVGAASLARSVAGVSRRAAAGVKRDELAAMERERQAACARVRVTVPGVMRGFDAMHLTPEYALVTADACVPFRTSVVRVPAYDAEHVARVLEADFDRHGAPLVIRFDRASCHDAPAVVSVLRRHAVLALHGPPRHPGYYGQLERQNVEHRGWLEHAERVSDSFEPMTSALNGLWRRPTLGWQTAAEIWSGRPRLTDDRRQLHEEVLERAAHLREDGLSLDLAMRLAIEQALIKRGYLRITSGQKLLRE